MSKFFLTIGCLIFPIKEVELPWLSCAFHPVLVGCDFWGCGSCFWDLRSFVLWWWWQLEFLATQSFLQSCHSLWNLLHRLLHPGREASHVLIMLQVKVAGAGPPWSGVCVWIIQKSQVVLLLLWFEKDRAFFWLPLE